MMWRFKTNWRGKLILQRSYRVPANGYGDWAVRWRDASTEDLRYYYAERGSYTSPPPAREWAGLTDDEQTNLIETNKTLFWQRPEYAVREVIKLVEAKLKEKNT